MKGKIGVMIIGLVGMALLVGCAGLPKVPEVKVPAKVGPVAQVRIKAAPAGKVAVGQSVVLTATAVDANGREVTGAEFTWKSDAEGKLSATKGKSVTFTLLKKPSVACFVSAKTDGEEGMIQLEGK